MTQNAATPHARLVVSRGLLLKSSNSFAHSGKHALYGNPPRWHLITPNKPAPKGAPVASHPHTAGAHGPAKHFTDEQWAALKLPEDNVNAGSHNKKIDHIKELSEGGHVTGLLGLGIGSNTYGKKQALVINHLLGLHGSAHKVTAGQKAGEHPAVQSAEPATPHPTGLPEHLAPKTTADLQEPGPLAPLAQHVKDTLDEKAAEGNVEFIKLVAANNPEHPQIVAHANKLLERLGANEEQGAPAAGTYDHGGIKKPIPSKNDESGTLSNAATGWLHAYQWGVDSPAGDVKNPIPSDDVIKELGAFVGKSPVKLYRAVYLDANDAGKLVESWTRHEEHASALVQSNAEMGKKMKIISQVFQPADIIVDTTKLPKKFHNANDSGTQAEVIIALGSLKERMAKLRAATPAPTGPLTMPAFEEGKTTTGVVDYYKKVAQKVIDHGHAGNASAPASMPAFDTYSDAQAWAKARAKEQGLSWQAYTATPEYKDHIHPALTQLYQSYKAGFDAESEATGKKLQAAMSDAGVKPGDTVSWTQVGQFLSQSKMAGVVKLGAHGIPYVHLDHEVAVSKPGGKIGYTKKLRWQPYMKASAQVDTAPKEGDTKPGADGQSLVFKNGRWHKYVAADESGEVPAVLVPVAGAPAPAAAPAITPETGNLSAQQLGNLQSIPWHKLKLPAENTNAKSHNAALAKIEAMAFAGDTTGLQAFIAAKGGAKQTYAKKQVLTAQTALAGLGTPAAKPAANNLPSMDSWIQTGPQGGSNPGGRFKDADGVEWYCKWPGDPDAIASEVLAAKLYALAGLSSQDCMVVTRGGKPAIATKWVNIKKAGTAAALAKIPGALDGFAVDAWLGNWDVVGMSLDNLQIGPDGKAHRVDAGGSLEYRAQGAKKPFGAKVDEIDTLRDAAKNPHAAAVFGKLTDADITASVAKVAGITDNQIRALVAQIGPGDMEARKNLADTLISRRADLIARYPKAAGIAKMKSFKVENITKPPNFMDFVNDTHPGGGPLSSNMVINEANNAAVQAAYQAAIHGNLDKIKNAVAPVFDKATHQVLKYAPLSEHPSQHVRSYWADLVNEVDLQLNPPQMPELGTVVMDEDLNAISSMLAPVPSGASVAAINKAQKVGNYIILGRYAGNLKALLPKDSDATIGSSTWKDKAKAMYHAASNAAKSTFSTYLSTAGARALNTALREGQLTPTVAGKTVKQHVQDFKGLLVDIPVGSTFVRRMGNNGYGQKPNPIAIKQLQQFLMAAEAGTVIQEPGFSSTSWTGGNKTLGNNDIEWEFVAGKGVKMYPGWLTANSGEGEGLLPPNQRYMIVSAKKDGKTVRVKAVLLPTID